MSATSAATAIDLHAWLATPVPRRLYTVQYGVQMSKHPDPPVPLSRERILDGALRLIEREGLGALSMRRLAQELDVWPMAVYHYFRDKAELLDAVAASAAGLVELPSPGDSWRGRLGGVPRGGPPPVGGGAPR